MLENAILMAPLILANVTFLGFLWKVVHESNKKQDEIKDQVKNSHKINLRDDIDVKHDQVVERLDTVLEVVSDNHTWTRRQLDALWTRINTMQKEREN